MAIEIERKFLVKNDTWRSLATGENYCQGYINTQNGTTVRVRIAGDRAYLTLKGRSQGQARSEFEYPIPLAEAQEILATLCDRPFIEKIRYRIKQGDIVWEVDEFLGDNAGLILAEVELTDENQSIELPDWIAQEVTHDSRYYNSRLAKTPYCQWQETA
jgi:CYTH domain-containing protein